MYEILPQLNKHYQYKSDQIRKDSLFMPAPEFKKEMNHISTSSRYKATQDQDFPDIFMEFEEDVDEDEQSDRSTEVRFISGSDRLV